MDFMTLRFIDIIISYMFNFAQMHKCTNKQLLVNN